MCVWCSEWALIYPQSLLSIVIVIRLCKQMVGVWTGVRGLQESRIRGLEHYSSKKALLAEGRYGLSSRRRKSK